MSNAPDTKASRGFDAKTKYVLGLIAASVVGFLIFRLFISDDKSPSPLTTPYSSEIAAAFAGTLLTVIVTALLLEQTNRGQAELQRELLEQTEHSQTALANRQAEIQADLLAEQTKKDTTKEKDVKVYEKKLELYGDLERVMDFCKLKVWHARVIQAT